MFNSGKAFYYLHIPKTAGTTICFSVLPQMFDNEEICSAHDYAELLPIRPDNFGEYRLFRGHFYYSFTRLFRERPVLMTMLRDPVERSLSHYDHICRDSRHYHYSLMPRGLVSAWPLPPLLPRDFQVASLAYDFDPIEMLRGVREATDDGIDGYSVSYLEITKRPPTRADLKVACQRLKEMEFVGIVERFDESLELLCSTFDWPIPKYQRINVAPSRTRMENVPNAILNEIREANRLDGELYEFANELLSKRVADSCSPVLV